MARWSNSYFGIKLENKELIPFAEKIFDCWDIDYSDEYYLNGETDNGGTAFGEVWDVFGLGGQYASATFGLLNKLFGNIKVCDITDAGNTITDGLSYESCMYDSVNNKWFYKDVYYDSGMVGKNLFSPHECMPWEDIKDSIEETVAFWNDEYGTDIVVSWINGENGLEPDPENEDFLDICNEAFDKEFSFEKYGTSCGDRTLDPDEREVNSNELEQLILLAKQKGYEDLVVFIQDRINSDSSIDNDNESTDIDIRQKLDMTGKIVITTGLSSEDEEYIKKQVEKRGGIYKPKFVKSINYLIYNPDYDHETGKLKLTKGLIAEGKDVMIITFKDFKRML